MKKLKIILVIIILFSTINMIPVYAAIEDTPSSLLHSQQIEQQQKQQEYGEKDGERFLNGPTSDDLEQEYGQKDGERFLNGSSFGGFETNDFKPNSTTEADSKKLESIGQKLIRMVNAIGNTASVIIIAILGLKYMLGSVEEKADYKKQLISYIIGIFLLLGITRLIVILIEFATAIK